MDKSYVFRSWDGQEIRVVSLTDFKKVKVTSKIIPFFGDGDMVMYESNGGFHDFCTQINNFRQNKDWIEIE